MAVRVLFVNTHRLIASDEGVLEFKANEEGLPIHISYPF